MKLLFDFFPLLLFFISYKLFGIYYATAAAMVASLLQVFFYRFRYHRYDNMHLMSLGIIFLLGGATLLFHNPWFIKWKPTGIYWLSALMFLGSAFIGNKPLIQKMLESSIEAPRTIWVQLNYAWSIFFMLMGALNLYVAYHYTTDVWVNFKLFGGMGLIGIFIFVQTIYLTKHAVGKETESPSLPEP